ncbi:MAG: amino acid ABC transporter permease [Clostridia bacterium]|nr:amino acid ABC transporter permease [Clostridia bacterium]
MQAWFDKLAETFLTDDRYMWLVEGLTNTLIITLGALAIGVVLGTIISVVKYFAEDCKPLKPLATVFDVYVTVIRGIPMTVLLLIVYYIIFASSDNGILVGIIAFGLNSAAYISEIVRGGINAVDKGQMEAARSLGMSRLQGMYKVVLPQAVKNILPAIGNEMIALLKETSIAGYVAVRDLTRAANQIRNITYDAVNPLVVTAITYLIIVLGLTWLLSKFEKRLRKSDKG